MKALMHIDGISMFVGVVVGLTLAVFVDWIDRKLKKRTGL